MKLSPGWQAAVAAPREALFQTVKRNVAHAPSFSGSASRKKGAVVDHTWRVAGPALDEFHMDDSAALVSARAETGTYLRNYIRKRSPFPIDFQSLFFSRPC